jgi:hypothetical protein
LARVRLMTSKVDQMTHATRMASVLVRPVRKAIARRNPVMFWQTSAAASAQVRR